MVTKETPIRILMIDDNEPDHRLVKVNLEKGQDMLDCSFEVDWAADMKIARTMIANSSYDALLLDVFIDGHAWQDNLKELQKIHTGTLMLITGVKDDAMSIEASKAGADDYIVKQEISPASFARALQYRIERVRSVLGLGNIKDNANVTDMMKQLEELKRVFLSNDH